MPEPVRGEIWAVDFEPQAHPEFGGSLPSTSIRIPIKSLQSRVTIAWS